MHSLGALGRAARREFQSAAVDSRLLATPGAAEIDHDEGQSRQIRSVMAVLVTGGAVLPRRARGRGCADQAWVEEPGHHADDSSVSVPSPASPGAVADAVRPSRALTIGLAAFALAVLAFAAWQVALRLPQRFELDYGEGFVWSEVGDLLAGRIYRPLAEYPHAIMHYTPLYHAVVALLWRLGFDPLIAGRAVSLAAGIALAGACGLLAALGLPEGAPRDRRIFAGLAAVTLAIGMPETIEWATLMRVDMLAIAFSFIG